LSLTIRKLRLDRTLFFQITQNQPAKTAIGKAQKYVVRGKPAISKQ